MVDHLARVVLQYATALGPREQKFWQIIHPSNAEYIIVCVILRRKQEGLKGEHEIQRADENRNLQVPEYISRLPRRKSPSLLLIPQMRNLNREQRPCVTQAQVRPVEGPSA
jgi:hypothetical protein